MIRHILLATNGSRTSLAAEDYALDLASAYRADLTVMHVKDDRLVHYGEVDQLMNAATKADFVAYIDEGNRSAAGRVVAGFSRKAHERGVEHDIVLASGSPPEKIVAMAEERAADLLVIGNGSPSGGFWAPSAGIAAKILKSSPCPVFTAV